MQTEAGKLMSVYHAKSDSHDIVNFKKGIAAAFQTNLNGAGEEEEVDPQSVHISHYRYWYVSL